jgi:hypothetical protein
MSVAASRAPATGIETALAATSNAPVARTSGCAPASAAHAALFPDLFGQMVETETEEQSPSPPGAVPGSKAINALTARASGKPAGERNRTASAATPADLSQNPATPDPASARTNYPWLPQDGASSLTAALSGPFSETGDTGGNDAAGKAAGTLVGADGEAASGQTQPTRAAGLKESPADATSPSACGEQPSNPITEATGGPVSPPAESALEAGMSAAAGAQRALELLDPQAAADGVAGAADGAGGRAARREQATPASNSQVSASSPSTTAASADDRMSAAGWQPAAPTRNIAETRPPEPRAAEPAAAAQAACTVAVEGVDASASLFSRLAAPSEGGNLELDRVASDQSNSTAVGGAGPPSDDSLAEQGILAFQALLVPAPASDPQLAGQGTQEANDRSSSQNPTLGTGAGLSGGRSASPATSEQGPGLAVAAQPGQDGGTAQALFAATPVSSNAEAGAAAPPGTSHQAASPISADLSAWDAVGPAPKPVAGGAAREIQLELRDADARVNVRLVERAGSVQVEVRTPDSHLAGSLRDDLPALAARLEQTGLRAETWHDAPAAAAARIKVAEPASSAGFQSSQNQSRREGGGRDPRDGQPQEKRQNQNQPESEEFSWLYTSLR